MNVKKVLSWNLRRCKRFKTQSFGLPIFSKIDSETFLVQFFSRPIPRFVGTNLYLKTSSKTSWFQILRHRFQSSILSTTNWKDPRTLCLVKVLLMGRIFISKVEIQAGASCAMHQKWARSIFEDKNAEPDKSPGKPSLLCVYFEKLLHGDVDCDNSGSGSKIMLSSYELDHMKTILKQVRITNTI